MKAVTVYLVQLPENAREVSQKAAREVWPRAQFVTVRDVAGARQHAADSGAQLLVLGGPDEAEVGLAAQTLDSGDLPRWAVVCLGRGPAELAETVPPEDWNVPLLNRVFRSSMMQHELLRENLQLRGDLKTIARRVNHDARTPLGCIQTVCELLKDVPPETPESLRETTDVIRSSSNEISLLMDRVSALIRATLDPVPPTIFAMGGSVDHVLEDLKAEIDASGRKIKQPPQWPEVEGVANWVEMIWWNLIRNALGHGAKAGAIQLGWNRENSGNLRFWVSSQGTVPGNFAGRLHRRFHLLHQNPSAGMGLSFVERLVSLQGGECGYETADDNRAVFFFTLRGSPHAAKESAARHTSFAGNAG